MGSRLTCKVKFEGSVGEEKKCILLTEENVAALPEGIAGQFLQKTENGYEFVNLPFEAVKESEGTYILNVSPVNDGEGYEMTFSPLWEPIAEMFPNVPGAWVFVPNYNPETGEVEQDWWPLIVAEQGPFELNGLPEEEGSFVVKREAPAEQGEPSVVSFEKVPSVPSQEGKYTLDVDSEGEASYEELNHVNPPSQAGNYVLTVDAQGDGSYTALPSQAGSYILNISAQGAVSFVPLPSQAGKYNISVASNGTITFTENKIPEPPTDPGEYPLHVLPNGTLAWQVE